MAEGIARRHRFLLIALWANVPLLAVLGLVSGRSVAFVGVGSLVLIALATMGMILPGLGWATSSTAVGLAAAASLLVIYYADLGVLHLYFAIVLVAVAFYRNARPLLAAVAAIIGYHIVIGVWYPGTEGGLWAITHAAMLTLLVITVILGWRLTEDDDAAHAISSNRYRTGFIAAPIGMAVLKLSGQFLESNDALAAMLGHDREHLPGRNIRAVVHSDDMTLLGDAWEEMGNSQSHTTSKWMRCLRADGGAVWTRVTLALVPHTSETSAMVVLQVEDATSTREEQARLEGLLRDKDEFVATVGNEMRGPLSVLIDLTDSGDTTLRRINGHAREIAWVLDDLVVSARSGTSPPDIVPSRFDVASACRRVLDSLAGGAQVVLDARASSVWADPALTTQIVTSLLGNAVIYGGPNARVQIYNSGPDTVVQVIDEGPEIPLEQRERIFGGDLNDGQPVTSPAVVGLSLTVGRHLARRMDGDMSYRRSGDGLNIFELRLPSEEINTTFNPRPRPRLSSELA